MFMFHIGDYATKTAHLAPMQDLMFRRMLDVYYTHEKPLPLKFSKISEHVRARRAPELAAIRVVLKEFFDKRKDGYHNARADEEILKFRAKSGARSKAADVRWEKHKTRNPDTKAMQLHEVGDANASALQCNHDHPHDQYQCDSHTHSEIGVTIGKDWRPSEQTIEAAKTKRPDLDIETEIRKFVSHNSGKTKPDPDSWFLGWIDQARPTHRPPPLNAANGRPSSRRKSTEQLDCEEHIVSRYFSGVYDPDDIAQLESLDVTLVKQVLGVKGLWKPTAYERTQRRLEASENDAQEG